VDKYALRFRLVGRENQLKEVTPPGAKRKKPGQKDTEAES